jgi:ABC-type multidrug transport system fused ATPase/permease subunit
MDILDICLGTNERSFSPGEMQALIMASQLHYAHLHNSQFLLLDELERNIDYETVKKIFDNIIIKKHINKHKRTIALITHNNELKMHLKQNKIVKQVFHFETIDNKMTFNVENISHKKD